MVKLDPKEVEKIQARFPSLNVSEIAARFENWARDKSDIRSPHGMLHSWCVKDDRERLERVGRGLEDESARNRNSAPGFSYLHGFTHTPYGKFRIALLIESMSSHPPLTPADLAQRLTDEADTYPEITKAEIEGLLKLGDDWKPRPKAPQMPQEPLQQLGMTSDSDIPF